MKDFRHLLCGNLTGQVGQIRSYGVPFSGLVSLIIHFIGLSGKGMFAGFCMRPPVAVPADAKGCKRLVACNPTPLHSKDIGMTTATVHKRLRPQAQEKDLQNFQAAARRILSNKKSMLRLLQATGLHDARGQLKPEFR